MTKKDTGKFESITPIVEEAPIIAATESEKDAQWAKTIVLGDENMPNFFDIPLPKEQYCYTWLNANPLNLKRRLAVGFRLVPKEHALAVGMPNSIMNSAGHAEIWQQVLAYIPRSAVVAYYEKKMAEEQSMEEYDSVQRFLNLSSPKRGIRCFVGDADEIEEFNRWRASGGRGSRVSMAH